MEKEDDDNVKRIRRDKLLRVLSHLETLVVSIDRIGSASYEGENSDELLVNFHDDWQVFKRLAECRSILSEPFSTELGDDDMCELERELQHVEYWEFNKRKPE